MGKRFVACTVLVNCRKVLLVKDHAEDSINGATRIGSVVRQEERFRHKTQDMYGWRLREPLMNAFFLFASYILCLPHHSSSPGSHCLLYYVLKQEGVKMANITGKAILMGFISTEETESS